MSGDVFRQNLDDKKGSRPGGPCLVHLLFKEPAAMPDKDNMTAVMEKHIGAVECFCHDKKQPALPRWSICQNSRTVRLRHS